MDPELRQRVEALRRPLELAAADRFAGVRRVQGLGHALRNACDGVIAQLRDDTAALSAWRVTLATWETLDEHHQAIEVARGMRLIARFPRPVVATPRTPTFALPPLARSPTTVVPARSASTAVVSRAAPARSLVPAGSPRATPASPPMAAPPVTPATPASAPTKPRGRAPAKPSTPVAPPTPPMAEPATTERPSKTRPASIAPAPAGDPLAAPTHALPGIGPAFAERLAERGLVTVEDLLWMVPRRYDDVRGARPLAEIIGLPEGERVTFLSKVTSSRMVFARGRRWGEARLDSTTAEPATTLVRWFNMFAGIDKRIPVGCQVVLSGVVKRRNGRLELANPDILGIEHPVIVDGGLLEDPGTASKKPMPTILARYPDVPGVPAGRLRSACAAACARVGTSVEDGVPEAVERAVGMPSLATTIAHLHAPPPDVSDDDLAAMNRGDSRWQRRLAFGELFALGIAVALRRRERRADAAVRCPPTAGLEAAITAALPFAPTRAQTRTIREIGEDLASDCPMNRLLQGDVGSGKTAVAFAAALQVARAGRQTAVMAPTELLSEQHAETWRRWSASCGLRLELLTASTPKGVRQSMLALLAAGHIDVLIGTHALLAEGVGFGALGLVIIDEQHRFGVAQRAKLRDKGDGQGAPHLLVMTATPIPRTLALTAYGDLDVSVLDELPPGRQPVTTKVLTGARGRTAAYKLIDERVSAGERVYVVCPKVEPGEDDDTQDAPKRAWKDATTTATELSDALPDARVGLVHGRQASDVRDRVMRAFKAGELDVLCATTVIEVGVDVPAATVMVVHDAERFGLAQLHQLRGRVGRGGGASHCVLLSQGALGEDAERRLGAMVATHDGFQIAEEDLALRGAGELLGARQAGVPRLRFGDLAQHTALLLEARRHAEAILVEDPDLVRPEHAALRRALERRLAQSVYGAEGG